MSKKNKLFNTKVIHSGHKEDKETGAVMPPIHLSSTYKQNTTPATKMIQQRFAIIQFLICVINYPLIPCRSHYRRLLGEYSIISLTMVIRTSLIV